MHRENRSPFCANKSLRRKLRAARVIVYLSVCLPRVHMFTKICPVAKITNGTATMHAMKLSTIPREQITMDQLRWIHISQNRPEVPQTTSNPGRLVVSAGKFSSLWPHDDVTKKNIKHVQVFFPPGECSQLSALRPFSVSIFWQQASAATGIPNYDIQKSVLIGWHQIATGWKCSNIFICYKIIWPLKSSVTMSDTATGSGNQFPTTTFWGSRCQEPFKSWKKRFERIFERIFPRS